MYIVPNSTNRDDFDDGVCIALRFVCLFDLKCVFGFKCGLAL